VAFAAFEAVQPLGDAFQQTELARSAAVRTFELMDAAPAVADPADPLPAPTRADVELSDVRFRYGAHEPWVLDGISLSLPRGARLAITGPSGAGKTTMVNLLLRFWDPWSGAVLVGGRDVRAHRAEDVRALFGVVPQRIYLFQGTLRDNLLLADGDADDARILEACRRAELGDVLAALPDGLDTLVGQDGLTLSGGERQRVALARAFLREAPILILDEATANLDAGTEARVLDAVRSFAEDRTLLVISHRPGPLELADRVVTLEGPNASRSSSPDAEG
jgi:ATP-binding cassette subfamily C protein CydC